MKNSILPNNLKKGDKISLISTARKINLEKLAQTKEVLNKAWKESIKNSTNKIYPDELSINKTITSIVGEAKDTNIALGKKLSAQQEVLMKDEFVIFPKNSVKSNVTIPKFIDQNVSKLNKQIQNIKI